MGLFKNIKNYIEKKEIIKNQLDQSIPNFHQYNSLLRTVIFVDISMLHPDKDSGSNRLKEIILAFKEQGFNCIICIKDTFRTDQYVNYFSDLGLIVYVVTKQYPNYLDFIKAIPKVDLVWYHGPKPFNSNFQKISDLLPHSKSVYDMVDLHFLRYQRAIKIQPTRISHRKKQKIYLYIETKLAQNVDFVITVSDIEKKIMTQFIDPNKLITVSNVHFSKIKKENTLPFEERKDLLFIGSTHDPNIDAVYYLYKEIMPIVWKKLPNLKVNIVGKINEKIKDITDSKFIFRGHVPDIEPYFISAKIMIAPLRYGAGVKGKIGQSFEYFLPVVTTSIGAEGMKLVNLENALIDDSKEGFAASIIELYNNKDLWLKLQENSEKSLAPFSKQALKAIISNLVNDL